MEAAVHMETHRDKKGKMHPKQFALMLMIIGMVMLFAGLTSAFIVRKAEGNWFNFELPAQFVASTVAVVVSSATMILAFYHAKRDNIKITQVSLGVTFLAGLSFVLFQYEGFMDLAGRGIYFSPDNGSEGGMVSGSFIIALVALHLLHLVGGLVFVAIVFIKSLLLKVHKKNTLSISMCNTYWHFVGILWMYLYLFLYFAPQL